MQVQVGLLEVMKCSNCNYHGSSLPQHHNHYFHLLNYLRLLPNNSTLNHTNQRTTLFLFLHDFFSNSQNFLINVLSLSLFSCPCLDSFLSTCAHSLSPFLSLPFPLSGSPFLLLCLRNYHLLTLWPSLRTYLCR
jgi:hypothetical protein